MILWEKQATASWLATYETKLELIAADRLAIISRPGKARSLVQVTCHNRAEAGRLLQEFGGTTRQFDRDWLKTQKGHAPIRVGSRLQIVSEVSGSESPCQTLVIPAAGAFGTGEHATTAMSVRLLEETTRALPAGWRLLDAGTGTGILALAARYFGAAEALGLDHDPRATAHARQNARLNQIRYAKFLTADLQSWKPTTRYDIITANLFSELLISTLPRFRRALGSTGRLIVSGILREQADSVIRALGQSGFELEQNRRRGKWVALLATRKAS